jgi:general secretion pathway protein N
VKRTLWVTLAALLAFAAILVARMPASWVLPSGPKAAFACASVEGSLWSGACNALIVQGTPLGDLTWDLKPLQLFLGRLAAHVTLNRGAAHGSADVELSFGGRLIARDVQAELPLDPKLMPGLPSQLHGDASAQLALAEVTRGVITQLKGKIEAHNLEDRTGDVTPLGSYVVSFPGGEGEPVGQVHDLGGPLSLEGTLRLTRQGGFDVESLVATRPEATPELTNNLRFLGSPDASGRRVFAMSGTF